MPGPLYITQQGFQEELRLIGNFLQEWNGKSFFLEDQLTLAPDFEIYTDAAGSVGYGVSSRATGLMGHGLRSSSWTPNAGFL